MKELNVDVKHQLNVDVKKYLGSEMDVMSKKIKNSIDKVFNDRSYLRNVHRCLSQLEKTKRHIDKIQYYEQIHEWLVNI